jgi:hypothetical protein
MPIENQFVGSKTVSDDCAGNVFTPSRRKSVGLLLHYCLLINKPCVGEAARQGQGHMVALWLWLVIKSQDAYRFLHRKVPGVVNFVLKI